jgi:hypothetical protein
MSKWVQVTAHAQFDHRDSARVFRVGGRQFISNGFVYGGTDRRDLWSCADPTQWEEVNSATPYEAYSAIIQVGSKLYAYKTQMWVSEDAGVTWDKISDDIGFTISPESPCLLIEGKIVHINNNGIWRYNETTGIWSQFSNPPKPPGGTERVSPNAAVFNDAVYLIGGRDEHAANLPAETFYDGFTTFNDVWKSTDGCLTWQLVCADMPFQPRMWPAVEVFRGKIWLMGGWDNLQGSRNLTDTYYSADGKDWKRLICEEEFPERHAAVAFVFNGELYIASGNSQPNTDQQTRNDIWKLEL